MRIMLIVLGAAVVLAGIYCLSAPSMVISVLWWIAGIGMLLEGIALIGAYLRGRQIGMASGWTLIGGILSALIGLFICGNGLFALTVLTEALLGIIVGIWLIGMGVSLAADSLTVIPGFHRQNRRVKLILGAVAAVAGLLILFNPSVITSLLGTVVGLSLIAAGGYLIVYTFRAARG